MCYNDVLKLCADFSTHCGRGLVMAHAQCLIFILIKSYVLYISVSAGHGSLKGKWEWQYVMYLVVAVLLVAVPNYVADEILEEVFMIKTYVTEIMFYILRDSNDEERIIDMFRTQS
jgi:phage-related holin